MISGENIAKLTDITYDESGQVMSPADKSAMVRAARGLLSAVTRVLLLADRVVIKQIQAAKLKVSKWRDTDRQTGGWTDRLHFLLLCVYIDWCVSVSLVLIKTKIHQTKNIYFFRKSNLGFLKLNF